MLPGDNTDELFVSLSELERLSQGEARAHLRDYVTELYSLRWNKIFRRAWEVCRNTATAEEVVQEAFLRLYQHLASGRPIGNHLHWMLTVARNLAIDSVRTSGRECHEPKSSAELVPESVPDSAPTPEEALLDRERSAEFNRLLARLAGTQRECLLLRASGVPFREIARNLGISMREAVYQTDAALRNLRRRARR
jgi:RNA polymerase sigma-70 factor (ECF subfamily)